MNASDYDKNFDEIQKAVEKPLRMAVVYKNPSDFPRTPQGNTFVVRATSIYPGRVEADAEPVIVTTDLYAARKAAREHLGTDFCVRRNPDDDPAILEVWL